MERLLTVHGLHAGYRHDDVVSGVDLEIVAGQFVSIIGPNGAGKSTLLRCLAGVLQPSSGTVSWGETPLRHFSRRELARMIAVVGEESAPFEFTVEQSVMMGRFAHIGRFRAPSINDRQIVQDMMTAVGMAQQQHCRFGCLSQGERQKVLLARALCQCPRLLLLDEPTSHLDVASQYLILHMIRNLALRKGITVVAVIHDINLAIEFSTELLFMKNGEMLAFGKPEDVVSTDLLQTLYGVGFNLHNGAGGIFVKPAYA